MNRKRLIYLARRVLPYVDPMRFYMGWWVRDPCRTCKTSACAFGHMAISRMGIKDGITLAASGSPIFECKYGLDAAEKYFEIYGAIARWLFIDESYMDEDSSLIAVTPAMVAERIECLLAADA